MNAEHIEVGSADTKAENDTRVIPAGEDETRAHSCRRALKRLAVIPPIVEIRGRDPGQCPAVARLMYSDQSARVSIWKGPKQDCVDDREQSRICRDTHTEGQYENRRKAASGAQHSDSES